MNPARRASTNSTRRPIGVRPAACASGWRSNTEAAVPNRDRWRCDTAQIEAEAGARRTSRHRWFDRGQDRDQDECDWGSEWSCRLVEGSLSVKTMCVAQSGLHGVRLVAPRHGHRCSILDHRLLRTVFLHTRAGVGGDRQLHEQHPDQRQKRCQEAVSARQFHVKDVVVPERAGLAAASGSECKCTTLIPAQIYGSRFRGPADVMGRLAGSDVVPRPSAWRIARASLLSCGTT